MMACATVPVSETTTSVDTGTVYLVYGGWFNGSEVVKTCETYQEALDFCNKDPISDPCVIIEGTVKVPECSRDRDGHPTHWGSITF
jgi:hypothetical protein